MEVGSRGELAMDEHDEDDDDDDEDEVVDKEEEPGSLWSRLSVRANLKSDKHGIDGPPRLPLCDKTNLNLVSP